MVKQILCVLFLFFFLSFGLPVFASSRAIGYDVSFPNCDQLSVFPQNGFVIIGSNNGKSFTRNPCLFAEYRQALQNFTQPISLYMNLNAPIGATAFKGMIQPSSSIEICRINDTSCQAFNYGYNAAEYAYKYATSQGIFSRMWWIDVELANSWFDDPLLNREVIRGALALFKGGISPQGEVLIGNHGEVGIYSTSSMWENITGSWVTNLPAWVSTDEELMPKACPPSFMGLSSTMAIIQYYDPVLILDRDIRCND